MSTKAEKLTGGDMGRRVLFLTEFGRIAGTLVGFGVPDDHPSLMVSPILRVEMDIQTDLGSRASFTVPTGTDVEFAELLPQSTAHPKGTKQ